MNKIKEFWNNNKQGATISFVIFNIGCFVLYLKRCYGGSCDINSFINYIPLTSLLFISITFIFGAVLFWGED